MSVLRENINEIAEAVIAKYAIVQHMTGKKYSVDLELNYNIYSDITVMNE